jgi:Amt family ammonium transporter
MEYVKPSCENDVIDSGDTSWLLCSSALISLMIIPGLALYYSGLAQKSNHLSAFIQLFSIECLVILLWVILGYAISFGDGNSFVGNGDRIWLKGSLLRSGNHSQGQATALTKHRLNCNIPETVLIIFQGAFATVASAIIYGAWAERMAFHGALLFSGCWHLLVYTCIARWHWSDQGWLYNLGALDYAGGDVVHVSAGFSGLAVALYLGPRQIIKQGRETQFNSIPNTLIGACLLWVGWFGFNGGSAGSANGRAGYALINTQVSAATSSLTWTIMDFLFCRHYSPISIARCSSYYASIVSSAQKEIYWLHFLMPDPSTSNRSYDSFIQSQSFDTHSISRSGAIVGLVVITPGCGYVDLTGAVVMALIGAIVCFLILFYRNPSKLDDAMDSFAIHGVGGVVGSLLTGVFANDDVTGDAHAKGAVVGYGQQIAYQLCGVCAVAAWSFFMTWAILLIIDQALIRVAGAPYRLAVGPDDELLGLDSYEHGQPVPGMRNSDARAAEQAKAEVVAVPHLPSPQAGQAVVVQDQSPEAGREAPYCV